MSHFRILRVDHQDPAALGKKNRILYAIITGSAPLIGVMTINLPDLLNLSKSVYLITTPVAFLLFIILLLLVHRKIKKNNNMDTIGHIEITQAGLNKKTGDSITEYSFQSVKELTLTKHMPATRQKESKSGYFSYILKIEFADGREESLIVGDRSIDHGQKISVLDTMKTLKKIVPFNVSIIV